MYREPVLNDPNHPLVSVLIFNNNCGRYFRQCFDSVIAQTYDNIDICFSDNASTDDSWAIAVEYAHKYPGLMTITSNRRNFGADANFANCNLNNRGKYFILLCSDDLLMPEYVEQCVHALEAYPNAGFAMVHRKIINKRGQSSDELPFYNQSCIIPGAEQAAMYMLTRVNPSISQVMYHKKKTYWKHPAGRYSSRILDFYMCCKMPIVYIKEPLLMHRLHPHSHQDSYEDADNLIEDIIEPYLQKYKFTQAAFFHNLDKVADILPQSLNNLSKLCLRHCVRALRENDEKNALRYFHLAVVITPLVTEDSTFKKLQEYWASDISGKLKIVESLQSFDNLKTRSVSYNPPPGSIPLNMNILKSQVFN